MALRGLIVVFGLSRSFPLSLLALAVCGFVDLFAMNIRMTIVGFRQPDAAARPRQRGGDGLHLRIQPARRFESGLAAFLFGAIAVVGGGAITIALALFWLRVFPGTGSNVDRLTDLKPEREPPARQALSSAAYRASRTRTPVLRRTLTTASAFAQ